MGTETVPQTEVARPGGGIRQVGRDGEQPTPEPVLHAHRNVGLVDAAIRPDVHLDRGRLPANQVIGRLPVAIQQPDPLQNALPAGPEFVPTLR